MAERDTTELVESALQFVSPEDRDLWIRVGMSIHAGLGDAGEPIWHAWSEGSKRYRERDARSVWRSFRGGTITLGTLFHEARKNGWEPADSDALRQAKRRNTKDERREQDRLREVQLRNAHRAAKMAQRAVERAPLDTHPYLRDKGFAGRVGLVWPDGNLLLIPMFRSRVLVSMQTIRENGRKLFMPLGCNAFGAIHRIGRKRRTGKLWLVEGYATGLSVNEALRRLYRKDDEVRVCFSTHSLAGHGQWIKEGMVIADNDKPTRNGKRPGLEAAKKSGLPYWLPPAIGDANDWHVKEGIDSLADALRGLLRQNES